ncbi:MAG: MFS transporter [Pseudonocardiaceae bacterium]
MRVLARMLTDGLSTAEVQRRVVRTLSTSQVLGGVGMATGLAVSSLIAASLSGSDTLGGLAVTSTVVGAALMSIPVARLAARRGRRTALLAAYAVATAGAAVATVATVLGNVTVLLVGLLAFGGATTAALAARYAATDLAAPSHRARDLALVVWATTVGAVAGPNLTAPANDAATTLGVPGVAGPFLLSAVAFGLAAVTVVIGLRPDPLRVLWDSAEPDPHSTAHREPGDRVAGWRALRSSSEARLALAGIVVCHTVMVGLMAMTPVHMDHGGASLQVVGLVISLHIAGMFAVSPLIGWLADRMGRVPVLALGAVLLVVAAGVAGLVPSSDTAWFSVGLVLLGLGWSCGLVAGSALLTESVPVPVRPVVQGIGDLMMNVGGALGGVLAGAAVAGASYGALALATGLLVLPFLVVTVAVAVRVAPG